MKIAVTGALGYVGSALIRKLPQAFPGSKIILLDNLSTGQLHALKTLPKAGNYQFIETDIRGFDFSQLKFTKRDVMIHLAGLSRPADSYKNPKVFSSVNVEGAVRTANYCAETSAAFLFPSTTSVYHQTRGRTISGCGKHLKPQTPYAATKLKAENALARIKGLRYTCIRFGTIFGMAPVFSIQTAVNKFCWQAATHQPISVWETALHQLRPYLALEDALSLILFLMKENHFEGKTYNASTFGVSVKDVLTVLKKEIPSLKIKRQKADAMNSLSYTADSHELLEIGFKFRGDLKKSILEILRTLPQF